MCKRREKSEALISIHAIEDMELWEKQPNKYKGIFEELIK